MSLSMKSNMNDKKLNRKQLRKNLRKEKKNRKNEWFMNRRKIKTGSDENPFDKQCGDNKNPKKSVLVQKQVKTVVPSKVLTSEEQRNKEQKQKKKLEKDMQKQRKKQLLLANEKEDQTIRKLEKQLKLNKRKTKSIPKSFSSDGLDFLLEVCDPEFMLKAVNAEQDINKVNDDFEEDLALMTDQNIINKKKKGQNKAEGVNDIVFNDFDDIENKLNEDYFSGDEQVESEESCSDLPENLSTVKAQPRKKKSKKKTSKNKIKKARRDSSSGSVENEDSDFDAKLSDLKDEFKIKIIEKDKDKGTKIKVKKRKLLEKDKNKGKKVKKHEEFYEVESISKTDDEDDTGLGKKYSDREEKRDVWEDIYGRLRSKDGAVIESSTEKYIPPAIRPKMASTEDKKRAEKLLKLKRQLKGLLNRLAESNMHSIASQIEGLYMNNSRNDMNESLTALIMDTLASITATPERLLMEHVLLVAILHANVGMEIGAHFLQTVAKKFDYLIKTDQDISNKTLDNITTILAQLYNFKVFEAKLLYEILHKLSEQFEEKNIDCVLHILRNVGFGLRKDDPLALKNLILELQKQAATASEGKISNSRIKFLLDILLAIKNNNMTKIPNYDPTYSEHLKKIMKGFIRKGNYVTQLNISLEDLLKADERGKWWVVGSAWTGKTESSDKKETASRDNYSDKLLELAKKQRMNTDARRDIFCIIMSAEDYVDAFEKLLKLGLKNQQEREIIHVILHCCLQEKVYNPYYGVLAQKFCEYDRKFQLTIKYSAWDKLKTLSEHSGNQISNLAKLLSHLFLEKGLPISTLKIVEFSELDKITLRFIRQILLGVLLHNDLEQVQEVFLKIAHSEKLKIFRESLRLFIHHFVLRNLKTEGISEEKKTQLEERAAIIEKILSIKESRLRS